MKRRAVVGAFCVLAVVTAFGLAASAERDIGVMVDGRRLGFDVPPRISGDRVLAPVRQVAEALGATVEWDAAAGTVRIASGGGVGSGGAAVAVPGAAGAGQAARRLELLESALAPTSPAEAAETWAQGVKTRNGALQYAVMSSSLRAETLDQFTAMNWCTGVSSPWVERYRVSPGTQPAPGVWAYDVEFDMATSTGSEGATSSRIYVEKAEASESDPRSGYFVVQVYEPIRLDIPKMKASLPAPAGWAVRNATAADASLVGPAGAPAGGVQVLGGLFLPNHGITQREITIGATPDRKAYLIEISEPAASGSSGTRRELHGFVPRGDGSYLDVWVLVSPGWSVESQVDMFARMVAGVGVSH